MPFPAAHDIEVAAHQNSIDLRTVYGFAAINGILPTDTGQGQGFEYTELLIMRGWQTSPFAPVGDAGGGNAYTLRAPIAFAGSLGGNWVRAATGPPAAIDKSVTMDVFWSYVNNYGSNPPSPQALISWAQGAGYVNSQGIQAATPPVGANYPPAGLSWGGSGGGSLPGAPAPAPNLFNFSGFFNQLMSNPTGAITQNPVPAAITALALVKFKPWKYLRGVI